MKSRFINSNEYGEISLVDIDAFAEQLSYGLPKSYVEYLLDHNGGMPANRNFHLIDDNTCFFRLGELFSLNDSPSYKNLNENWNLAKSADLSRYHEEIGHFFSFGEASAGASVVFDLRTEQVFVYDPDHEEFSDKSKILSRIKLVSSSFENFISSLISDEEAERLEE